MLEADARSPCPRDDDRDDLSAERPRVMHTVISSKRSVDHWRAMAVLATKHIVDGHVRDSVSERCRSLAIEPVQLRCGSVTPTIKERLTGARAMTCTLHWFAWRWSTNDHYLCTSSRQLGEDVVQGNPDRRFPAEISGRNQCPRLEN